MSDYIIQLGLQLVIIFACGFGAYFLKNSKQTLTKYINTLIQMAEVNVQGSKLGAEKKAWVIKQLEATGIIVTDKTLKIIDELVEIMNKEKTSLLDIVIKAKK